MLLISQHYILKSILMPLLTIFIIDAILKGIALYKAGNRKDIARFICIFIFNTCGLLPAIYLIFANNDTNKSETFQEGKAELQEKKDKPTNTNIKKVVKATTKQVKTGKKTIQSKKSTQAKTSKK